MKKKYVILLVLVALIFVMLHKQTRKRIERHYWSIHKDVVVYVMTHYWSTSGCPDTQYNGAEGKFFSQGYEDYILSNIFEDVEKGFYVDVGANNPNILSATLYFYKKGWRGMNFEPQPKFSKIFQSDRAEDINIQKAVSKEPGTAIFFVPSNDAGATLDPKIKTIDHISHEITVEVTTLTQEFEYHNIKDIDFLKIDVEGFEGNVIDGLDLQKFRPKVIVLEYISPIKRNGYVDFEPKILENGYILGVDDGLNRYYYRQENHELEAKFKVIGRCVNIERKIRRDFWGT